MGGVTAEGSADPAPIIRSTIEPGTAVDVRNRFDRSWSSGFEVESEHDGRYRIRRLSDLSVVPGDFERDDIRRHRSRQGFWWH